MSGRVIVVGSVNVDLVINGERLPAAGETVTGGSFWRHQGGKGGNQAVAAARLGVEAAFVGAVGDDDFGAEARDALAIEGIDLGGLSVVPGPTGVALILVDARAENLISVASGANAMVTPDLIRTALANLRPTSADVVLVGNEIPTAAARAALDAAGHAGATTILNPAPAGGIDRSTFGLADILTPNRGELVAIAAGDAAPVGRAAGAGGAPQALAQVLLDANSEGPGVRQAVVVTLGAAGALLVPLGRAAIGLPTPAIRAIDSVGAGDAFNGALAAGLAAGLDLDVAAQRAVVAAAVSTTKAGAREGMPTAAELDGFVARD